MDPSLARPRGTTTELSPSSHTTSVAASRHSRSPHSFARLRQTRVASLSPTPTLVSSSLVSGGGARNRHSPPGARGTSRSRGPASRRRDASTTRFSIATAADEQRSRSRDATKHESLDHVKTTDVNVAAVAAAHTEEPKDLEKGLPAESSNIAAATPQRPPVPPVSRLSAAERVLPHPVPHFLGYRRPAQQLPPHHRDVKPFASILPSIVHRIPLPLESIVWCLVGAFVGIAVVQLTFARPRHFTSSIDVPPHAWAAPIIIGSFGASSVLLYAVPASPLGQPRCFVGGQVLSALVGVAISKLLKLAGPVAYDLQHTDTSASLVWVAGALATACALLIMTVTGTMHPPGGATALLCATNAEVSRMGWKIIPVVLLSSIMMLVWSLIWMNLGRRRYPESFFAAAPAAYKDGNLVQGLQDFLVKRHQDRRRRRQSTVFDKNHDDGPGKTSRQSSSANPSLASRASSQSPPLGSSNSNAVAAATAAATTGPTPTKHAETSSRNTNDLWLDETDWHQTDLTVSKAKEGHDAAIYDDDVDVPVERPSRWASTAPRTANGSP